MTGTPAGSASISPTAHYTAFVWARHGLAPPELATTEGRLLFNSVRPTMAASKLLGGPTLEDFLLARHRLIDHLLEDAIVRGDVSQVVEIACGLSARGWRFAQRHGDRLTYVEADLPQMAARKRRALERAGSLGPHHRVVEIDALSDDGPQSLSVLADTLDRTAGLAIVTEGLLSYLDRGAVDGLWRRAAQTLTGFSHGVYLSDLHLSSENAGRAADAFRWMLAAFVRGRVEIHFADVAEAAGELEAAGFGHATLHSPTDFADHLDLHGRGIGLVHVIEATT